MPDDGTNANTPAPNQQGMVPPQTPIADNRRGSIASSVQSATPSIAGSQMSRAQSIVSAGSGTNGQIEDGEEAPKPKMLSPDEYLAMFHRPAPPEIVEQYENEKERIELLKKARQMDKLKPSDIFTLCSEMVEKKIDQQVEKMNYLLDDKMADFAKMLNDTLKNHKKSIEGEKDENKSKNRQKRTRRTYTPPPIGDEDKVEGSEKESPSIAEDDGESCAKSRRRIY